MVRKLISSVSDGVLDDDVDACESRGYSLTIPNINAKHTPETMITYITSITRVPGGIGVIGRRPGPGLNPREEGM